jgi:hypothetical protein
LVNSPADPRAGAARGQITIACKPCIALALEKHLMIGRRLARSRTSRVIFVVAAAVMGMVFLVLPPGAARAQPAPGNAGANKDLGENIKTATNVGPFGNQIQDFVNDRVKALGGSDPAAQSRAREDLVRQVGPGAGGAAPSRAFLTDYATRLNTALLPLAQSKDTRVRLNTAIVSAKVAQGAKAPQLLPVTLALLKDASDGVMLWALRGAAALLPAGGAEELLPVIVQTGQTRPRVIGEVYAALAVPGADGKTLGVVVPAIHTVMESRIGQYKNGLPQDPTAETRAAVYLTARSEYQAQSLPQKVQTVKLLSDLLEVVARRAADVTPEQRRELVVLARGAGAAASVVGQWETNPTLQAQGKVVASLPIGATENDIQAAIAPLRGMIKGIDKFKNIPAPPVLGQMAADAGSAPPPPATASTSPSAGR